MLFILITAIFVQTTLVILSIGAGRFIIDRCLRFDSESVYLRMGSCFFIGVAFLIVFTRLGTFLSKDASLSSSGVIFITIILSLFSYSKIKSDIRNLFLGINFLLALCIILVAAISLLIYWLPPENQVNNPFSSIGSLHSVRYAWITNSILENNNILVFPQNTAQSILAFISSFLSFRAPFLYLFLWLFSSLLFLSLFVYGLICKLAGNSRKNLLGITVFMMGSSALSLTHILIIDSGSPFLLNGYTDTILGIFSLFFLLIVCENINNAVSRINIFFITLLIVVLNFLCAPQNVIFFSLIPISLFIFSKFKKENCLFVIIFWVLIILVSALISIPLGGMLTPKLFLSPITYSGIMSPAGSGVYSGIQVYPGIPFYYGWMGNWESGLTPLLSFAKDYFASKLTLESFLNKSIWGLEQITVTSLRVLFFVIVGIFFLAYKFKLSTPLLNQNRELLTINSIGMCGIIFFFVGLMPIFLLMLNGYKWELSRFLIPGISIGFLGLSLGVIHLMNGSPAFKKYIIIFCFIFILGGPFANLVATIAYNFTHLVRDSAYKAYFVQFIGIGPSTLE